MVDTFAQGDGSGSDTHLFLLQFPLPFSAKPKETDGVLSGADLKISPNPAQDHVFITSSDPDFALASIELYDAVGRVLNVAVERFDVGVFRLDLRSFPAGVYWVTIRTGDRRITRPLVRAG
jgi:Secretion system C-terminal sorting domain